MLKQIHAAVEDSDDYGCGSPGHRHSVHLQGVSKAKYIQDQMVAEHVKASIGGGNDDGRYIDSRRRLKQLLTR